MTNKAVVVYSGGMDSFTVLNKAIKDGKDVYALSFNYGQRHSKELIVAAKVCQDLNIPHKVVNISAINELMAGSSLTDEIEIPEGHYAEESMKSTVVPNRNMVLLSMAIAYAVSLEAPEVYYGAHSGDHHIYPDCRPAFVNAMNDVSKIANYQSVEIVTPYLSNSKGDILEDGLTMGLNYANTWTCYNGREKACGKCGACTERLEAFSEQNTTDPLAYEV
ncbi:7-cyano-7-deazaguanine synthase QueC [Marinomonas mediterranea]|jgi:preQ(0) biosynthesis protein QueC|uniref:7-cyano-7-deazaguanine synthase n=1 Tax=Marinomonas mediterranea (strain ATCC 700492 / JCM 21426 / NBRC 103028 / MMB-1) TaxID=717774 RepID=F2JTI9_MARM1|nr:7-cyano-7-deazaguanine synthase QueC [Marinomonas mediterranea]ADZ91503.1 exsB protein [Marinomonas mediterranea MMB-1]WCN09469.1 7-cyano-7-deazaguanine synthase QueC [Marinomonas mediterranea]WCN17611.1 7-cyano-7-deazaguanine synthase QueC [Marinomonas mediterranea MMB-1]